jgi:hypothetical protein
MRGLLVKESWKDKINFECAKGYFGELIVSGFHWINLTFDPGFHPILFMLDIGIHPASWISSVHI